VEKRKEATGESVIVKNQKKKLEREEEKLKTNTRDLSLVKMKSMFAIGVAFTALLSIFNSMYARYLIVVVLNTYMYYVLQIKTNSIYFAFFF